MMPNLMRPREFQRRNREYFPSYEALRYHITNRRHNGMLESGAVVESPIGLRIDVDRFPAWLLGKFANQPEKAAA